MQDRDVSTSGHMVLRELVQERTVLVDRGSVGNSFEDEHARLVEKMN